MGALKYQLPHFLYFIDDFSDDDILIKKAFVLKLDYDTENDAYFDLNKQFYEVNSFYLDDFKISINLIGEKHALNLGDIIGEVYQRNLDKNAAKLINENKKKYNSRRYEMAFKHIDSHPEEKDDIRAMINLHDKIGTVIGRRPTIKVKDLPIFFPYITSVMQEEAHDREWYFIDRWEQQFVKDGKKINAYSPSAKVKKELIKLEEAMDIFDSFEIKE